MLSNKIMGGSLPLSLAPFCSIMSTNNVTYSIGYKEADIYEKHYITLKENGDDPKAYIKNGIIYFDTPQTNDGIGVGDKVVIDDPSLEVLLNKKITCKQWEVTNIDGTKPSDIENSSVVQINKMFDNPYDAFYTIPTLIKSLDLSSAKMTLRIAFYKTNEAGVSYNISDTLSLSGFVTDFYNRVIIFTPSNISTECNKVQNIVNEKESYIFINSTTTKLFDIISNMTIQGFTVNADIEDAAFAEPTPGLDLSGVIIKHNIINGFNYGVNLLDVNTTHNCYVIENYFKECVTGIRFDRGVKCWNNTFKNSNTSLGIDFVSTTETEIKNCIFDCTTAVSNDGDIAKYCLAKDESIISGEGCVIIDPSSIINDRDEYSQFYYHVSFPFESICIGMPINDIGICQFDFDLQGNRHCVSVDNVISNYRNLKMGHISFTKTLYMTCGKSPDSFSGSITGSITGSLLDLSDNTLEGLHPGTFVSYVTGATYVLIYQQAITNKWWVSDLNGDPAPDTGSNDVTIYYSSTYIEQLVAGDFYLILNYIKVKIYIMNDYSCVYNGDRHNIANIKGICDQIYNVTISTPEYINAEMYPTGKWSKYEHLYKNSLMIANYAIGTVVDGLYIYGESYGIITFKKEITIKNCIIKDCSKYGIYFASNNVNSEIYTSLNKKAVIFNNLFINCGKAIYYNKIDLDKDIIEYIPYAPFYGEKYNKNEYSSRRDVCCYIYSNIDGNREQVAHFHLETLNNLQDILENDLIFEVLDDVEGMDPIYPILIWGEKSLTFRFSSSEDPYRQATIGELITNQKISNTGTPWALLTGSSYPLLLKKSDSFRVKIKQIRSYDDPLRLYNIDGAHAANTEVFPMKTTYHGHQGFFCGIYNNTIVKCEIGMKIGNYELNQHNIMHAGIFDIKNNIIQKCKKCYDIDYNSPYITFENNISDDDSMDGYNEISNSIMSIKSFNYLSEDFLLSLNELNLIPSFNMEASEKFSFNYDCTRMQRKKTISGFGVGYFCKNGELNNLDRIRTVNLSFGPVGSLVGAAINFTVYNSVVTFDGLISTSAGIGCTLKYGSDTIKLVEKITDYKWLATDVDGFSLSDLDSTVISSLEYDFTSFADLSPSSDKMFALVPSSDLASEKKNVRVWFYQCPELTSQLATGEWVTSKLYNIQYIVPYDIKTQCYVSQRHAGTPNDGFNIGMLSDNVDVPAILIETNFFKLDGFVVLAAENDDRTCSAIEVDGSCHDCVVIRCITVGGYYGIYAEAGENKRNYILSCISMEYIYKAFYLNNSEARLCTLGKIKEDGPLDPDEIPVDLLGTGNIHDSTYYYTEFSVINTEKMKNVIVHNRFASIIERDWRLTEYSLNCIGTAKNSGQCEDGQYIGSDDEYRFESFLDINSAIPDKLSVGAHSPKIIDTEVDMSISGNITYSSLLTGSDVTATINNSIIKFSSNQTNLYLGRGCKVIFSDRTICNLRKKISDSEWEVTDLFGRQIVNTIDKYTYTTNDWDTITLSQMNTLERVEISSTSVLKIVYDSSGVLSLKSKFLKLVNIIDELEVLFDQQQVNLNVFVYKSVNTISYASISFKNTSGNYHVKFKTPEYPSECNSIQKHEGRANTDVHLPMASLNGLSIVDTDYTEVDGIIFPTHINNDRMDGSIELIDSSYSEIKNNIVYGGGSNSHGIVEKYGVLSSTENRDGNIVHLDKMAYEIQSFDLIPYAGSKDHEYKEGDYKKSWVSTGIDPYPNYFFDIYDAFILTIDFVCAGETDNDFNIIIKNATSAETVSYAFKGLMYENGIYYKIKAGEIFSMRFVRYTTNMDLEGYTNHVCLYFKTNDGWIFIKDLGSLPIDADRSYVTFVNYGGRHALYKIFLFDYGQPIDYYVGGTSHDNKIFNNIVYDKSIGIGAIGVNDFIVNNTVVDCEICIVSRDIVNLINNLCSSGYGLTEKSNYVYYFISSIFKNTEPISSLPARRAISCTASNNDFNGEDINDITERLPDYYGAPAFNGNYNKTGVYFLVEDSELPLKYYKYMDSGIIGKRNSITDKDACGVRHGLFAQIGALNAGLFEINIAIGDTKNIVNNYSGLSMTIQRFALNSVVTFSHSITEENFGIGYTLKASDGVWYRISGKISSTQWYITLDDGSVASDKAEINISILRKEFQNLNDFANSSIVNDILGTSDLISAKARINVWCYSDIYEHNSPVLISDFNCNQRCCISISCPDETQANKSQFHNGIVNTGTMLRFKNLSNTSAFYIYANNYIEISKLQIDLISESIGEKTCFYIGGNQSAAIYDNIMLNMTYGVKCEKNFGELTNLEPSVNVFNNLMINCKYGVRNRDYKLVDVWFNTFYNCEYAVHAENGVNVKYNIMQKISKLPVYIRETSDPGWTVRYNIFDKNIDFHWVKKFNYDKTNIVFEGVNSNNFNLHILFDILGINKATYPNYNSKIYNVIDNVKRPLLETDITSISRLGKWEIGAYEVKDIIGSGDSYQELMMTGRTFSGDSNEYLEIYLRKNKENFLPNIDESKQFYSIDTDDIINGKMCINSYLASFEQMDNLIINVQANETFAGLFDLGDRSASREVIIRNQPTEITLGPPTLVIGDSLYSDESKQSFVTILGMIVQRNYANSSKTIIVDDSLASNIVFINSILCLKGNSVIKNNLLNNYLVFFNSFIILSQVNDTEIKLINNEATKFTDHHCYLENTSIYVNENYGVTINIGIGLGYDTQIAYCNFYNVNTNFLMFPTQDPLEPHTLNNVNPLISNITKEKFIEVVDTANFDAITKEKFIVNKKSPLIDAGYTNPDEEYTYDIMGNNRVLGSEIDIGPFETTINDKFLLLNDIEDIFQSKIIKYSDIYSIYDKDVILRNFYSEMTQGEIDEYIKSYKIFIKIKSINKIELHSDKKDIPIDEYDALYDSGENILIVTKNSNYSADVFSNFFNKDQYILYYDDTLKKLYVYYKYTSTVAAFGKTAPLNLVKF